MRKKNGHNINENGSIEKVARQFIFKTKTMDRGHKVKRKLKTTRLDIRDTAK